MKTTSNIATQQGNKAPLETATRAVYFQEVPVRARELVTVKPVKDIFQHAIGLIKIVESKITSRPSSLPDV